MAALDDESKGLVTLATFTHQDGGVEHMVELPQELIDILDPRQLVGMTVMLDGKPVKVKGVNAHCVMWPHGALRRVGLLISNSR